MYATLERRRVFQRPLFFSGRLKRWKVHTHTHTYSLQIDEPASDMRWSIFPVALNCICVVSYGREYLLEIRILQGAIPFCTYAIGNGKYMLRKFNVRNFFIWFVWSVLCWIYKHFIFVYFFPHRVNYRSWRTHYRSILIARILKVKFLSE